MFVLVISNINIGFKKLLTLSLMASDDILRSYEAKQ